jgi:hypothetical protein
MAEREPNPQTPARITGRGFEAILDVAAGSSLGVLLGLLTGLSGSPVVSIVITALVALLAGMFGLIEKVNVKGTSAGSRRLTAFALTAALSTPLAIWMRTHDVLAPSIDEQKRTLRQIGYADGRPEQVEMLRYLRYGLLPAGVVQSKERLASSVLYAELSPTLCDALARTRTADDLLVLLKAEPSLRGVASTIASMPRDKRDAAPEWAKVLLCPER